MTKVTVVVFFSRLEFDKLKHLIAAIPSQIGVVQQIPAHHCPTQAMPEGKF